MTSFAAPEGPGTLGSGTKPKSKVLGQASDDEDEGKEDEEKEEEPRGIEGPEQQEKDTRFYEQESMIIASLFPESLFLFYFIFKKKLDY